MVWSWIEDTTRTQPGKALWSSRIVQTLSLYKQDKQATLESVASDQLAQMEALRGQLAHRRDELQAKIDQLTTKTVPANLPPRGR
jgi:chromosome condensin MukBEF ATPase and DNA-binding subunit MukB